MAITDANDTTEQPMPGPTDAAASPVGAGPAALSGAVAAAGALAAGEFAASLAAPRPGPVIAVANRVIDQAPTWFIEFGKNLFQLNDKPALIVGTVLLSLLFGAVFGLLARRSPLIGIVGFVGFGLVGLVSMSVDAQSGFGAALIISIVAVGTGLAILHLLPRTLRPNQATTGLVSAQPQPASPTNPPVSRRRFLGWAGMVGATGAVVAAGANEIRARSSAAQARDAVEFATTADGTLAEIEQTVAAAASGPVGSTEGITPLVVPSDDFYLIDTALTKPQVDPDNWTLTIKGMVDQEVSYTYDELLDRAETIAPVTLSCVSNEVGGDLVGNAIWRGVPLTELLDEAGVQPGATQIASRSVDGWTCGFPTEAAYDGRTALLAVGMNGEPLPIRHGFPARLVVSGLYGYVSATKWIEEIELTTLEDFDGFWIPRGWSKLGPVKTQSRIDTPRRGVEVVAGSTVPIAGVAWAPDAGITKVEVRIDEGDWFEADLGETLGPDAWIQWLAPWTATEGRHTVQVRATDSTGFTQPSDPTPPAPNGAQGWHQIEINAV